MKQIDVAACLEHMRDQRMSLVANERQYEFVLTCIADETQAILQVHYNATLATGHKRFAGNERATLSDRDVALTLGPTLLQHTSIPPSIKRSRVRSCEQRQARATISNLMAARLYFSL